jgi:hypothetical protein
MLVFKQLLTFFKCAVPFDTTKSFGSKFFLINELSKAIVNHTSHPTVVLSKVLTSQVLPKTTLRTNSIMRESCPNRR